MKLNKRNNKKVRKIIITLILSVVALSVSACSLNYKQQAKIIDLITENKESGLDETIEMLKEVEQRYLNYYIDDIDYELVKQTTVNAMINAFGDKYGLYIDPNHLYVMSTTLDSSICGIGILTRAEINEDKDYDQLYVIEAYENSGARKAGLDTGDIIIKANGKSFKFSDNLSLDTFLNENIRGEEGTSCTLTFIDVSEDKEKTVEVHRGKVRTSTVKYDRLTEDIGYIKISEFNEYTDEEFKEALDIFEYNNINKVVFDLRDNPGGLLESVLNMVDYFLPNQIALTLEDKDGNTVEEHRTKSGNEYNIKGICLVDSGTASAAELFTQTLHDYDVITTIGEKTYGKGTVCTVLPASDGGQISISTDRYIIFSGYEIEGKGVTVDYEMKLSDEKQKIIYKLPVKDDDLILKAVELLNS